MQLLQLLICQMLWRTRRFAGEIWTLLVALKMIKIKFLILIPAITASMLTGTGKFFFVISHQIQTTPLPSRPIFPKVNLHGKFLPRGCLQRDFINLNNSKLGWANFEILNMGYLDWVLGDPLNYFETP